MFDVAAILVALVALRLVLKERRFLQSAVQVTGHVTGYTTVQTTDSEGKPATTTMMRVHYVTRDGHDHGFSTIVLTKRRKKGSPIEVLYDPARAGVAQRKSLLGQWGWSLLACSLSAMFLVFGSAITFAS